MADDQISKVDSRIEWFKNAVSITMRARFRASHRLIRRHHVSTYVISMLSLYVVALSLLPFVKELNDKQSQLLNVCAVILSIFIIIVSLHEGSHNFFHKGNLLHDCGRKIGKIHSALRMIRDDDCNINEKISDLHEKYHLIIEQCQENHTDADYLYVVATKRYLFPDRYTGNKFNDSLLSLFRIVSVFSKEYLWVLPSLLSFTGVTWIIFFYIFYPPIPHQ